MEDLPQEDAGDCHRNATAIQEQNYISMETRQLGYGNEAYTLYTVTLNHTS